jgi:hypothetical protein
MNRPHAHFNALLTTERFWRERISAASIISHSPAKGDVAEAAWRSLLRTYLPGRYQVSPGFVVSADNKRSDQIDCVVYDNVYTPVFFSEHGISCIPVEAVHAVFEVKQQVTPENIRYAVNKAASVRSLHRTSTEYIGSGAAQAAKGLFPIIAGLMAHKRTGKNWDSSVEKLNAATNCQISGALDIVLTAEDGSVDYFSRGFPSQRPKINSKSGGLMAGILRFLMALQRQGTVPAIDWEHWIEKI